MSMKSIWKITLEQQTNASQLQAWLHLWSRQMHLNFLNQIHGNPMQMVRSTIKQVDQYATLRNLLYKYKYLG
jgi:hypothetical protein